MKIVTISEMQGIEKEANDQGLSYDEMMENAGRNLADVVNETYNYYSEDGVIGLVGKGNNGGDTLVALSHLADMGWKTTAYLVSKRSENDPLVVGYNASGGNVVKADEDKVFELLIQALNENAVLLDGVLGTGIKLPLRGKISTALAAVQKFVSETDDPPQVIAVDCPSGVDCDTGEVAPETIPADMTVTMAAVKVGMFGFPAFEFVGNLKVVGIGLSESLPAWKRIQRLVVDDELVRDLLPERPLNAHKGTFGTAMVIAGSVNYTGAAYLAGKAAYRVGAGLVTLAVPSPLHTSLAGHFPEATWLLLPNEIGVISEMAADVVKNNLERVTAILVGPGFGVEEPTKDFIVKLITEPTRGSQSRIGFVRSDFASGEGPRDFNLPPTVLDADGLKLLTEIQNWHNQIPKDSILTPHPGEMSVLTGLEKKTIQKDRLAIAERYAKEWGHVVVLKGAFTLVAAPDGRTALIPIASPALARAGSGDVLAGMIVGLRAQGMEAYEAALAGAWLHAQAGVITEENLGSSAAVLAGDILDGLVDVMQENQ